MVDNHSSRLETQVSFGANGKISYQSNSRNPKIGNDLESCKTPENYRELSVHEARKQMSNTMNQFNTRKIISQIKNQRTPLGNNKPYPSFTPKLSIDDVDDLSILETFDKRNKMKYSKKGGSQIDFMPSRKIFSVRNSIGKAINESNLPTSQKKIVE